MPDTSNSIYGTVTDEIRHDRNYSSSTFYIDPYGGAHKILIQELPMSIPDELSYKHKGIFKVLMQGPLEDAASRISTRSSDKDLYQIMQRHREDFTRTSSRASHKDL